ncbi:MAG: TVP38/TMEM64 family protein [Chloroflexota bacterium]|nr:TVP38/TMEM64 family protein [Chloroflexota bacterium]
MMTHTDHEHDPQSGGGWKQVTRIALLLIALTLLVAAVLIWYKPFLAFFGDRERVADYIRRWGAWAPVVTIGFQVLQVIAAPVPGQALDVANGYLFGPLWGTVYSMIGMLVGSFIAMGLTRRFGRPLAERLVGEQALERVDHYARHRGPVFFLIFFLMPVVPNDVACFLAGLTAIPLAELMLIALVGRMPSIVVSNLVGATVTELTLPQMIAFGAGTLLVALVFWRWQARIEESMMRLAARLTEALGTRRR